VSDIRRRPIGSWAAIEAWEDAQRGWCPGEPHPVDCDCCDCDAEHGIETPPVQAEADVLS